MEETNVGEIAHAAGVDLAIKAANSQKKLAEKLRVSQQRVSEYKVRGYMPAEKAIICQHLYGIPYETLIKPKQGHR